MPVSILIVEDDVTFSVMLSTWLTKKKFLVESVTTLGSAKKKLIEETFAIVLSDLRLPDGNGIDLLRWAKEQDVPARFIMMTHYADIQTAVQAIKLGAFDYIAKPILPEDLLVKIHELLRDSDASTSKQEDSDDSFAARYIIGNNAASRRTYEHADLVAPTDMSVLITGDSGTGKEYVARYLHEHSPRRSAPFIAVDCGAIPRELAASEFFGHVKGSFTGAIENKTGAFVAAAGGTIFLDEIGNLTYEVQIQLLRALQERKIKPIGTNKEIEIDIRLISATNENLRSAIDAKEFREDLFHRLNEFTIRVPSLRERREDIMLFAERFLVDSNQSLNRNVRSFSDEAIRILETYPWPGNLRQLRNVIKYATLLATTPFITRGELPEELTCYNPTDAPELAAVVSTLKSEAHERDMIAKALVEADNNKTRAAQLLGVDRKTLYNKMKQYGIK